MEPRETVVSERSRLVRVVQNWSRTGPDWFETGPVGAPNGSLEKFQNTPYNYTVCSDIPCRKIFLARDSMRSTQGRSLYVYDADQAPWTYATNYVITAICLGGVASYLLMRPKAQPDIEKPRLITISRTSPTEMLGLKVYTLTDGSRGNRVGAIIPEKAASRSKGLMLNDVIMEVDEKKCLDLTHDQVMGLLKRAGQVLTMKVVSPAGVPLKTEEEKEAAKNAAAAAAAKVAAVQAGSLPPLPNSPAKAVRSRPAQQKRQPPPPWYAGKTTPLATCIKMVKSGKTGCFLIRVGGDSKRAFLMVNDDKEVAEFVIDLEGGKFEFGGRPHKNLEEIVENLKVAAIRGLSGRPITLTKPATMPTRKKKKGTKAAEAAKQQGYASAVPSQRDAAKGTAPTLTSAQGADRVEEAPPPVPSRAAKPSSSTAVSADAFDEHVRELRGDGAVAALFDQIQVEAQANPGTYDNAKAAENKTKNRYDTDDHFVFFCWFRNSRTLMGCTDLP